MRSFTLPPTLLAGFVAVLVGYASSAAIIWQAAAAAGASAQIAGWMTALAWEWASAPWRSPSGESADAHRLVNAGAALLVSGLQG
jgi:benzoate membrane transport protein